MQNIRNLGRVRFPAAAIALLMLTCGTPPSAWCASKNLWVANQNGVIESYDSKQLRKSGMPAPVELNTTGSAQGLAFDKSKNLWATVHPDHSEVVQFTAAQLKDLKHTPNPTPAVVISTDTTVVRDLFGCHFDSQGNLWIADTQNGSLDELSKAQLAAGSAEEVTPNIIITSPDLFNAEFVTFDKDGNAWVSGSGEDTIAEFTASQLTSGGSKSATIVLTANLCPEDMEFDKEGDLWVAGACSDTVVKFAKSQLASSGSPTPTVTLSSASFNEDEPSGLAFDSSGDLLVATFVGDTISKLTPKQLKVSGAPVPKVVVTIPKAGDNQIIFGPAN